MLKRTMLIDSEFLHIPVKIGSPANELQIWLNGVLLYQFSLELSDGGPYHYFFMDITDLKDTAIDLVVPRQKGISAQALSGIFIGQSPEYLPEYADMYNEKLRPQFHFTCRRGWLNDPNGLYWHDGVYHMFYQHNPFGTLHGGVNISWGHATSKNLLQWHEHKDAIFPWRRDWMVASGSAIIDSGNVAGYGKNAVIAAFTGLGTIDEKGGVHLSGGQFLAASTDDGQSFYRFSQFPSIEAPGGADWRDPRLFEDGGIYYIAVYERLKDINGVSFYKSVNLHDWEFTSWNPHLFECPDIFKLCVEGSDEEKWVLFGADGLARLGTFKEGFFIDEGIHYPLDYGFSTYAGQTWSHAPNEKRIHISWIRGIDSSEDWEKNLRYTDMPFSQCMSVPCEITLHKQDGHYHICRFPIKEIEQLRTCPPVYTTLKLQGSLSLQLQAPSEIILHVENFDNPQLHVNLSGHTIDLDMLSSTATIDDKAPRKLLKSPTEIRVLTDRTTVEFFIGNEVCATYATDTDGVHISLTGDATIRMQEWELCSIWETRETIC